jgi:hypothetical protein
MEKLIKILDFIFNVLAWTGIILSAAAEEYLPAILLAILLIHNKLDGSNIIIIKGRN